MFRFHFASTAALIFCCATPAIGAETTATALTDFPPPPSESTSHDAEGLLPPPPPPRRVYEPPVAPFGAAGQLVITAGASGSNGASVSSSSYASGASITNESISLGFDLFVLPHLSLGLMVSASGYDNQAFYGGRNQLSHETGHAIGAGVRVGVDVPLGDTFSLYPSLTVGLESITNTEQVDDSGSTLSSRQTGGWSYGYLPILVHAAPHLFVGLGPYFRRHFGDTSGEAVLASGTSSIGAAFVLGGAWGGGPVPQEASNADVEAPRPRFGEVGQFVLDATSGASFGATFYPTPHTSSLSVNITPGFDYFVAERVSLGVGVTIAHNHTQYDDVVVGPSVSESTSTSLDGRLGIVIPLNATLSLYPRAWLGVGEARTTQPYEATTTFVWVGADAPILVHLSTHFFVGAGPYVNHDLSRQVVYDASGNSIGNNRNEYGLTTRIGGWL